MTHAGKGAFLLCRTSNPGGGDFKTNALIRLASADCLPLRCEHLTCLAQGPWHLNGQLSLVVGAPDMLQAARG